MLRHLFLLAAAAGAALVIAAVPASAQPETGPNSSACATAAVEVLARASVVVNETESIARVHQALLGSLAAAVDTARDRYEAAVTAVGDAIEAGKAPTKGQLDELADAEKALTEATAAVEKASAGLPETDALRAAKARLDSAVAARNEACADPAPEPTPAPRDLDCSDFVGADGRLDRAAAQSKLDEDKSDPHNLDVDGDGLACEDDEPPAPGGQVGQVPVGPAETGGM